MLPNDKPRGKMGGLLMFCSKCGKLVTDNMKFCNSCGEKIEILNKAESIIPMSTENVVTKKSLVKKKGIFIAMAAIVIVGLIITNFIINRPISGPEVLYDLKWGMAYEQVKAVDSKIGTQEFKQLNNDEQGVFLSTIDYNYMHINSKSDGAAITYHFGVNNSLEKIEIQYISNTSKDTKYDYIMKKLEKYYSAVCKTSPTKGTAAYGNNEMLIWNTTNNQISVGGDFNRTDYVFVTIIPNTASNSSQPMSSDDESTVSFDAFTFNESVFQAQNTLITWFEDIGNEWDATPSGNIFDVIQATQNNYPDVYAKVQSQHNSIESTYNNSLSKLPDDSYINIYNAVVKLHEDYIALYSEINCTSLTLMDSSNLTEDTWSVNVSDLTTAVGEDYEALNALKYSKN